MLLEGEMLMLANVDKRLLSALLIAVTVIAAVIIVGGVFLAIVKARKRNSPQIMRSIFSQLEQ